MMNELLPKLGVELLQAEAPSPWTGESRTARPGAASAFVRQVNPSSLLAAISVFFHYAGAALLAVMCALICADAGARLLFNAPFAGTAELVASMLLAVTCLQLPYVLVHRLLLRVTFFLDAVGPRARNLLNGVAYCAGFAFFAAISLTSIEPLLKSVATLEYEGTMTFQIPMWPIRLVTCVLWALSGLVCLTFVINAVFGRMTHTEDEERPRLKAE